MSKKVILAAAAAVWSQGAFAFFDASLFYGSRTSTVTYNDATGASKNKDVKGTDMGATFLLDPIPVVPVAFGVTVFQGTTKMDDINQELAEAAVSSNADFAGNFTGTGTGTSKTMFYGPTLKVWAPIPFVKPYLKASYLLGAETDEANYTIKSNANVSPNISIEMKPKTVFSHSASEVIVGLGYSPVKLTSIFVEYAMHTGKRKAKGMSGESITTVGSASASTPYTDADLSDEEKKEKNWNSKSINFGVSVGI
jgi:hypothetical protein